MNTRLPAAETPAGRSALLSDESRLLKAITDNASSAIFIMDERQHCAFMNPAAERLTGYTLAEVQGRPLHEIIHHTRPDGSPYPAAECPIDRAFPEENRASGAETFIHRDGHFLDVTFVASPLRDEAGRAVGTVIEVEDASERRQHERALHHHLATLEMVLNYIPIGVYLVDADFKVAHVNPVVRAAWGDLPNSGVGRDFTEVVHVIWNEKVAGEIVATFRQILATGESVSVPRLADLRADRQVVEYYEWRADRITLPDGRFGVLCCFRDISAQVAVESQLLEADRRKDEFVAVLAHELRNPLAPIRTSVGLMRVRDIGDPIIARCRDVIDRQVSQMSRLLDDLLDVSRLSRGQLSLQRTIVPLRDVLDLAVETSRPLLDQHGCQLTFERPPADLVVDGDPARLAEVFANLLNNAAKYNRPGGQVAISLTRTGSQVQVRVADTGVGIAPEFLPHIFELFAQGDGRRVGGLGIGLNLASRLVQLHGGTITASSQGPGCGSQFTVTLPLVERRAEPAGRGRTGDTPRLSARVLIAEDNIDGAEMLSAYLSELGATVSVVHDGESAVREAARQQPDVALLDIGLPVIDGYTACRRIRATPEGQRVALVALTGWGQEEDVKRSEEAGFDLHLVKPIDPDLLAGHLRRLLARPG